MTTIIKLALVAFVAVGAISSASACDLDEGGFLAALGKCVVPDAAPILDGLDRANGEMGRPVERAIGQGLNYYVPGASVVTDEIWGVGSPPSAR